MAGLIPLLLAGGATTNFQDGALAATGTGTALFVGVDATPAAAPTVTVSAGGAGAPGAWRQKKKRKKKEALDELDELIVAVRAQIKPWESAKAYDAGQAIYRSALKSAADVGASNTLAKIESEIVNLKELLAERDEEEAILMLLS